MYGLAGLHTTTGRTAHVPFWLLPLLEEPPPVLEPEPEPVPARQAAVRRRQKGSLGVPPFPLLLLPLLSRELRLTSLESPDEEADHRLQTRPS